VLFAGRPADSTRSTLIWDGEWQVTHDVFLDMGIAFAVVMILIYLLVVAGSARSSRRSSSWRRSR